MEGCIAVEREVDRVLSKFQGLQKVNSTLALLLLLLLLLFLLLQRYHQASTIVVGVNIDALFNLPLKEALIRH